MRFDILLVLGAIGANGLAIRAAVTTTPARSDGRCGVDYNWAGCGSGSCCSQYGWCGSTTAHCASAANCQLSCTDGAGTIAQYSAAAVSSSSSSTLKSSTSSSKSSTSSSKTSSTSTTTKTTTTSSTSQSSSTSTTSPSTSKSSSTSTTTSPSTMKTSTSTSSSKTSSSLSTFISTTTSKIVSSFSSSTTSTTTKPTSSTTSTTTTKTSSSTTSATATSTGGPKAVFAHYMVGGMTQAEAVQDVAQAQAMGLDAFALNVQTTASWCTTSVSYLFAAAEAANFKLFFSFDMSVFTAPSQFIPLLNTYIANTAHYTYGGLPFVSTFYGGTLTFGSSTPNAGWQTNFKDVMSSAGTPVYFVPAFNDAATTPSTFYSNFPVVDGQFNWDGSWPYVSQGLVNVSSTDDQTYITSAKSLSPKKTFMMGISSLQFKHMDSSDNWYRRGGLDLALRIPQILSAQPDFVEIQTWNDAGESHYIGPIWSEAISGTTIPAYTDGYDHSGWQNILGPFAVAYRSGATSVSSIVPNNGKSVQGVFWHSTLLSTATCSGDSYGKPSGSNLIQDTVEVAVIVTSAAAGGKVSVYSAGNLIGSYTTTTGLNSFEVFGLTAGLVKVVVTDSSGNSLSTATGSISVKADSSFCNYNPQVVAL